MSVRYSLATSLTLWLFLAVIGKAVAEKPAPPGENSVKPTVQAPPEVLCERTEFGDNWLIGGPAFSFNNEMAPGEENKIQPEMYALSSVTVPAGGWKIDAISIFTNPTQGAVWSKVSRARLSVFAKKDDFPDESDDPQNGREVEVKVRKAQKGVYDVRAADLGLTLEPGEYWIGLTPICSHENGFAAHLTAFNVQDARFDDVQLPADEDLDPEERQWAVVSENRPGEHLSIRIEGWHLRRGELLDWPSDEPTDNKRLHLRFGAFDPLASPPQVTKELMAPEDTNLWIVQCRQTVDQDFRDQLTSAGAALVRYLPDDAYIVRFPAETVEAVRGLGSVRWIGPYHPAYRLDPTLHPEPLERNSSNLSMRSQAVEPEGWRNVMVYLFDRAKEAKNQVRKTIKEAGGKVVFQSPHGFYLAANVPLDKLNAVARCDAISAIERRYGAFELGSSGQSGNSLPPLDDDLITLSQIRELCGADAIKKAGGYEGLGVRVAFWDHGIRDDHVDLLARPLTILGPKYFLHADHGTQVASILCGEGRVDPRARGLLPLGGLVFATDQGIAAHEDRYGLVEQFVKDHRAVLLSSSSSDWGGGGHVKHYDGYSFLVDDLVLEHDLLICTGMGNHPGNAGGCGSWSKNALLVGGVDARGSSNREAHRYGHHTSGPAPDGRIKPDLVHFGTNVYCADASSAHGYGSFGGTSCATPLVAGHCGLMMEMWADGAFGNLPLGQTVFDRKPHAATAKALMINSAYRYSVEGDKPAFTRFKQGWGMPDLARLYESRDRLFVVDQETALGDHQAVKYRLRVPEGEPELRVTLAFTDPLGTTAASKAMVNDLDLVVIAPDGKRYFGNHGLIEGNVSKAGGKPDRLNNVENVFLDVPTPGEWQVIVAAHRIASDQYCGTLAWDQNFALVISGVEGDLMPLKPLN